MNKIIIVCGLMAGLIVSTFMITSINSSYGSGMHSGSIWLGYASMLLSFSLIFVGVKNFRDKYNHGNITFGKAFMIGLYITLIASTIYVISWTIDYFFFVPDFMVMYTTQAIKEIKESGASAAEIQKKIAEINESAKLYDTPIGVILLTYMEILPVGLLVSLICALILKRKSEMA